MLAPLLTLRMGDWEPSVPLESMRPIQTLNVDKLLSLLNKKEAKPVLVPASGQPLNSIPRIVNYTTLPSTGEVLRSWIDEWLDSGLTNNGDEPRTRNLDKAEGATLAAYEFSKRGRIVLLPHGDSLGIWIPMYGPEPTSTLRPSSGPLPEDYAREHLVFFLLSELRFKLAKCRKIDCGKYFLLTHTNRLYKRGTLCSECGRSRSLESAKDATAAARKSLRAELWLRAAKRFSKRITGDLHWYRDDGLKQTMSAYLNSSFGDSEPFNAAYPNGITGKWIANPKNWKPITKAAKGGK